MLHMTNENLYRIATLLSEEEAFEQEDMLWMAHIIGCTKCSAALKRAIAVVEATDHIAEVAMFKSKAKDSAVIQIVVLDTNMILQQLQRDAAQWLFEPPLHIGRKRSAGGKDSNTECLEDLNNSKTFVTYDGSTHTLTIQIDGENNSVPKAKIREKNGAERSISFDKCGAVYRAEVTLSEQGEYELILEK